MTAEELRKIGRTALELGFLSLAKVLHVEQLIGEQDGEASIWQKEGGLSDAEFRVSLAAAKAPKTDRRTHLLWFSNGIASGLNKPAKVHGKAPGNPRPKPSEIAGGSKERRSRTQTRISSPPAPGGTPSANIGIAGSPQQSQVLDAATPAPSSVRPRNLSAPTHGTSEPFDKPSSRLLSGQISVRGLETGERGTPSTLPPELAAERYSVQQVLAVGGMGVVYEGYDAHLDRNVAIKALRPELIETDVSEVLAAEAKTTGQLEHPNIVPVYDMGITGDGVPFYVMRLAQQPTLADVLDSLRENMPSFAERTSTSYGGWSLARLLRCFMQVCEAVRFAHSRDIIHCDLKPSNILVGNFGEVLVADWGMSVGGTDRSVRGGTFGYMPPEQLLTGDADILTDIFALGAILYEILTFRQAFPTTRPSARDTRLAGHLELLPVPPTPREVRGDVPQDISEVCMKAIALDAKERYQSVQNLLSDVEAALEGRKEYDRKAKEAEMRFRAAKSLADKFMDLCSNRPGQVERIRELSGGLQPWDAEEAKQPLWEAEDALRGMDLLAARTLQAAIAELESVQAAMPGHSEARTLLAGLYIKELENARERGDTFAETFIEAQLEQLSDVVDLGRDAPGLILGLNGEVMASLVSYKERARRLVAAKGMPLTLPTTLQLAPGSYSIVVHEGPQSVVFPIHSAGNEQRSLTLSSFRHLQVRPDEVIIPGGPALIGGPTPQERKRQVEIPTFVIQRKPVTFREYFAFLKNVAARSIDDLVALTPRTPIGSSLWQWNGRDFSPDGILLLAETVDPLDLPAFGIDISCCEAFAAYMRRLTGLPYRLPTADEWEKAARGTDGRSYPWGNHFDAAFCKVRESRPERAQPEVSGAFTADVSPYGVIDCAGGVADWVVVVRDGETRYATKGGAWCDGGTESFIGHTRYYDPGERTARTGFRLVRSSG